MKFKIGDIVKTKLYGNKFLIKAICESEYVEPYVLVSNEPYQQRSCTIRMMIDKEKFERGWYKVSK